MTTTAQDLVNRTKLHLLSNTREEANRLTNSYTAGATSMTFDFPMQSITAGANIEIDSEVLRVISVSGNTATVMGAQLGSVAANHSAGATVLVNPRFFTFSILTDLNNTLNDLSANGLYRDIAINIVFNPVISAYDITGSTTVLDILEVRYKQVGPTRRFPVIRNWSVMRDMDTTVFPSGNALVIDSPGFPGLPLRVRYAAPFTEIVSLTDDITATIGLPSTAQDLPPLGAAIRQMVGREVKRTFLEAQPDTRRAAEVPSGQTQASIRAMQQQYEQGVREERMRLLQRFPPRMAI